LPWTIEEFVDAQGRRPVREFVQQLTPAERGRLATRLRYLQLHGLQAGTHVIKKLQGGKADDPRRKLWELRLPGSQHNPRILLFATVDRKLVLLHGFKKIGRPDDKIPRQKVNVAVARMLEYQRGQDRDGQ